MSNEDITEDVDQAQYRIGAVCRITGLSPHVLRVWEKRYGVVSPIRLENNRRLYSERDLNKLIQLKALVDDGHAIGSIAGLAPEELAQRASTASRLQSRPDPDFQPRTLVVGETLTLHRAWQEQTAFDVVHSVDDIAAARKLDHGDGYDLLLVGVPGIQDDTALELVRLKERLDPRLMAVVYNYASQGALRALDDPKIITIRGQADFDVISGLVLPRFGAAPSGLRDCDLPEPSRPRRFTERQLVFIAGQSASLECECPSHLSGLVADLTRFETYSAECASRSAEDAAVHRYLHDSTSQARQIMETALQRLVEFEKLEVPDR